MSTVLEAPRPAVGADASPATRARGARHRAAADGALARPVRFAAFSALVVYGCEHWVRQVAPTDTGLALRMAAVAIALALGLTLAGGLRRDRTRRIAIALLCVVGTVAAVTAAGIPLRFAGWRNWGALATGVGQGLETLPNLNVPYRGLDEWVRWTIACGAALLGVLAAALAFTPGRGRLGAAVALSVLYGVPIVERNPESPFVSGAGFAVLLGLFLGAERLAAVGGARPRLVAAGAGVLALALAALVAPQLDGDRPWLDYRGLAGGLGERRQANFDWNHRYSPLDWPRDGRELLRVTAKEPAYWKASALRRFDGVRWEHEAPSGGEDAARVDTPRPAGEGDWYEDIDVTVRGLRSEEYVTAGFADEISGTAADAQPAGSGTFTTSGRALRPGDTYTASVYVPRPTQRQMAAAGTQYPDDVQRDLEMELPEAVGGPEAGRPFPGGPQQTTIRFAAFGTAARPTTSIPGRPAFVGGEDLLEQSGYARTWAEAQRLRAAASSPLELVRSVRGRVQQGARYTERPAQRPVPLDAFLFDTKEGYCQQFSGAMALMLRMAGVPARVASGFTPGSFDSEREQYIVRDLDAHSWVEAYFPSFGWVTFDPTPTIAPPSSQEAGDGDAAAAESGADGATNRADVPVPQTPAADSAGGTTADRNAGSASVLPYVAGGVLLLLAGLGAWLWRRRPALPPLEELRRALARSGRAAAPGLTLQALERSLAGTPAAQGYVRKLRMARYAGREEAPSGRERAALRDELAAGLGVGGRLRAWWALPPRLHRR